MPLLKPTSYTSDDYWSLSEGQRAELINGELYDMTPPSRLHQKLVAGITHQLISHIEHNDGSCEVYPAPFAVNVDAEDVNWVEPDISLICDPSKLSDRGCEGAPDLVVEVVSPASQRLDYLTKATLYDQTGVREYWIVDPKARHTMVYRFETGNACPTTYPFEAPVPVGIWEGACAVDLSELAE